MVINRKSHEYVQDCVHVCVRECMYECEECVSTWEGECEGMYTSMYVFVRYTRANVYVFGVMAQKKRK